MTEADKTQKDTTAVSDTTSGKRCGKKGWVCLVVLLLVFGAGLGAARCPWVMRYYVPQHDTHLTAMQVEIEALTQRVDALEKKADQATVAVTQPAPQATDNTAKVDVQALNARLDQLQKDVQQASVLATQSRDATHGQIAI
ncbi:MAG: hypothetical protein JO253_03680, partial [Alphaproteobacteria bacterium]|nr:hypothetical protein [Alphaproteobacteria bacterium]